MASEVALPDWFVLDGQLPAGFTLDQPSVLEQEGYGARPILRAARDVASGAAGAVDVVEKPIRLTIAAGLDAAGFKDQAKLLRDRATLSDTVQQGFDKATGGLTAPRNTNDKISDVVGEVFSPGVPGLTKVASKADTAANAVADLTPKAKTAEELVQHYKDGREALKAVEIPAEQIQSGLVQPITDALKHEHPDLHGPDVQRFLQKLNDFAKNGVNANALESFRQDVGQLPSKYAQPMRDAIDNFYEQADLPTEFRSAYAVMKRGENLQNGLTKAGDSITKQRNFINSFLVKEKGLSDYEKQVLIAAGQSSTPEAVLRKAASVTGPLAGAAGFGFTGNPFALAIGAIGPMLRSGADKLAKGRIEKAVEAVKGRSLEDLAK